MARIFQRIVKKYRKVLNDFLDTSSKEKWLLVQKCGIYALKVPGVPILDPNFKPNILSLIPVLLFIDINISTIYTLNYYSDNIPRAIQCFSTFGISVPSIILYWKTIGPARAGYQSIILFGGNFIYSNTKRSRRDQKINKRSIYLISSTTKVVLAIAVASILFVLYPIYELFFQGRHSTILSFELPFSDPASDKGYYMNLVNQLILCVFGILANIGIEIVTCIINNNLYAGIDVIENSMEELDSLLLSNTFTPQSDKLFRSILIQMQDLDRYIVFLCDLYYWKFFFQPVLITFSIIVSIFCIIKSEFTAGYGIVAFMYVQLLILCNIGMEVKVANKALQSVITNSDWYLLPPKKQLMLGHMLKRLQNGAVVTMGPFNDLDFQTVTGLTKTIYTFTMALLRITQ